MVTGRIGQLRKTTLQLIDVHVVTQLDHQRHDGLHVTLGQFTNQNIRHTVMPLVLSRLTGPLKMFYLCSL